MCEGVSCVGLLYPCPKHCNGGANPFAFCVLHPCASQGLVYQHSARRCRRPAVSRAKNAEVRSLFAVMCVALLCARVDWTVLCCCAQGSSRSTCIFMRSLCKKDEGSHKKAVTTHMCCGVGVVTKPDGHASLCHIASSPNQIVSSLFHPFSL